MPAAETRDWTDDVARFLDGTHTQPHAVLGAHPGGAATVVRAFQPDAVEMHVAHTGGVVPMRRMHDAGLFEAVVPVRQLPGYRLRVRTDDAAWEMDDPYRFLPTLGELDQHLIGEGNHRELWRRLGARVIEHQGVRGTAFAVWAPNARGVHLVSDANQWDTRTNPMRMLGSSGVWELFLPNVGAGTKYKYWVARAGGGHTLKADPLARAAELPPRTASIVDESRHEWHDTAWMMSRGEHSSPQSPIAIYEVHLGSWQRGEHGEWLTYET